MLTQRAVQTLTANRLLVSMAGATLFYAVLVHLALVGATQFEIAVASSLSFAAALAFGYQGGLLADLLQKRQLIVINLFAQAALCFIFPRTVGTGYPEIALLIFLSSTFSLLSAPAARTIIVLVAKDDQIATTAALLALVGLTSSALGSSAVAPLVLKHSDVEIALYVAGGLFVAAALVSRHLPVEEGEFPSFFQGLRQADWKPRALSLRYDADWIMENRAVSSMVLGGIVTAVLFQSFHMLLPGYIRDVLHEDPADGIYIFLPAGIGLVLGAYVAPRMVNWAGERRLLLLSLALISVGLILLGAIDQVASTLAPLNPMGAIDERAGLELRDTMLAAGIIALPANIGSTWSVQSVQVFVNRRVPKDQQGQVFGTQKVLNNLLLLFAIPGFGFLATHLGTETVYVIAPLLVSGIVLLLIRLSYRHETGHRAPLGMATQFVAREEKEDDE